MDYQTYISTQKTKKTFAKGWILACRPETKTLSVCLIPILVSIALVYKHTKSIDWILFLSACFFAPCIQMGMNMIGDALDYKKGEVLENKLGDQRAALFPIQHILNGGYFFLTLAAIFALPLMVAGGGLYVVLVCVSIACAYCYTGGPYPFGYLGLSEFLLLIFYGWVAVLATYYIQTHTWNASVLLAGAQMGCLAIVPLAINNFRDYQADALIQKKTLAVRFGLLFSRWEITLFSLLPFIVGLFWISEEKNKWMAFLPCFVLIPTVRNLWFIWNRDPSRESTASIARSAKIQLGFGLLLILGSFM